MNTFKLNGQTFDENHILTITTPEIGTVQVAATIQSFSQGHVLGLDLGWIKTPQPCLANVKERTNARLSFYSNNMGYETLQLAYHCPCGHSAHVRSMEWDNLQIQGDMILTGPARQDKKMKPAPIVPSPPTVIARPQTATPVLKKDAKKPVSKASDDGQFKLF